MTSALDKIREGWRTGKLCDRSWCLRDGPHFPGEYGCVDSDVAIYLPDQADFAVATWTNERIFGQGD